jgi:hypothetical protein
LLRRIRWKARHTNLTRQSTAPSNAADGRELRSAVGHIRRNI